jgi:hypothetical protein
MAKTSYIKWENNDVIFVLYCYSIISLKQQSAGRHDAPLERNSLIPSQPTSRFSLSLMPRECPGGKNYQFHSLVDPTTVELTIHRNRGE